MSIVSFVPTQLPIDLTTRKDFKEQVPNSGGSDAQISAMITHSSQRIFSYLNRGDLRQGTTVEALPATDVPRQYLRHRPIKSVSLITEDGSTLNEGQDGWQLENKERGSIFRRARWFSRLPGLRTISRSRDPEPGEEVYEFTYLAGWYLPSWTGTPAVGDVRLPHDIEDACIQLVQTSISVGSRDPGVVSESLGSWSATYRKSGERGIPAEVKEQLGFYKRLVQAG